MGCYCDYEVAGFLRTKIIAARKQHACCECGHVIVRDEKYEQTTGSWGGRISRYKTCERCADLRDAVADYFRGCVYYGGLYEDYVCYLEATLPISANAFEKAAAVLERHRNA